ncbi:MAG: hypothetical protein KF733_03650 [Fimbriimonadaceae bacterium]|nr:MAG: hypothetical protein KF733_03650 [Fimbriimonadaceae bacterium]
MLSVQASLCFLLWIGWGLWQRRRAEAWHRRFASMSRGKLALLGSLGFIFGAALLFGALFGISAAGGIQDGSLTPLAWAAVALTGLVFVASQTAAATALVHLTQRPDTAEPHRPSDNQESSVS